MVDSAASPKLAAGCAGRAPALTLLLLLLSCIAVGAWTSLSHLSLSSLAGCV